MSIEYRRSLRIFLILLSVFMAVYLSSIIYQRRTAFDYAADLDKTVLRLDERDITLRDLGYYIAEVEAFTQQQAVLYDPDDPLVYWNAYFSARDNSTFVSDYARETAINNCLCDLIYETAAAEAGLALTEREREAARREATLFYICLSDEQREAVGLTEELVVTIEERKALAERYVAFLLSEDPALMDRLEEMARETDPPIEPLSLLSGTGAYFRGEILPRHKVVYNRKILRKLPLGRITVNRAWE